MAKKHQKTIKTLQLTADELDNVGIKDTGAWQKLSEDLSEALNSIPKKQQRVKELLDITRQGLIAMANQSPADPLALIDAIWEGLNTAIQCLSEGAEACDAVAEMHQNLAVLVSASENPAETDLTSEAVDIGFPRVETLDDAAALLIQIEPDNSAELQVLRQSLLDLTGDADSPQAEDPYLKKAIEILDKCLAQEAADSNQSLDEIGALLEAAIDSKDGFAPASDPDESVIPDAEPADTESADDAEVDHMPRDADTELIAEFIAEGSDLISSAEEALLSLETDPEDMESVGKVFRAFHTVKGTSAFLDLSLLSEFGHHAESLLSRVRDGEIRYSGGYADLSLRALDMIKDLLGGVEAALGGQPLLKPDGYDQLVSLLADPEAAGVSENADDVATPRVGEMLVAQGKVERDQIEEAAEQHPEDKLGVAVVKSKAASATDVAQALRAQKRIGGGQPLAESSVRVSTRRLDRLIDMVGELVIAHSMVAQDTLVANSDNHELAKKVSHTSKIVRELQDISMSMRMVPLKATFNKMARLVRDVSRKVGKNVNFVTEGEDTEIDRNLVNIINDPLVHMVRNAVDHGIERPDQRTQAGKPEYGTVQLMAYHSAGSVVVEIRDDGQGLDRDVILANAREKGLISDSGDAADRTLSDREVFNLIFEPGFSTAEVVTDVSGRGVGMDVVKKNIESLRGQVEIRSDSGQGSVFKMSLPLTLAIIDGMVVRVGSETYVIPTVSIIRSIKPKAGDISTVLNQGEMVNLQGSLIALYRMASIYHIDSAQQNPEEGVVVILEDDEQQAGLLVDELIGRQQVVIKSLGESMKDIPGISGGAIMPDGRVGLIIDVGGLVKFANNGLESDIPEEGDAGIDRNMAA